MFWTFFKELRNRRRNRRQRSQIAPDSPSQARHSIPVLEYLEDRVVPAQFQLGHHQLMLDQFADDAHINIQQAQGQLAIQILGDIWTGDSSSPGAMVSQNETLVVNPDLFQGEVVLRNSNGADLTISIGEGIYAHALKIDSEVGDTDISLSGGTSAFLADQGLQIQVSGSGSSIHQFETSSVMAQQVLLDAGSEGELIVEGRIESRDRDQGGVVHLLGRDVSLMGAQIDASGQSGGTILIGGDWQGSNPAIRNAENVSIDASSKILANANGQGDAGRVIVWSDGTTQFAGSLFAQAEMGEGGFAEISGKEHLDFDGKASLHSVMGQSGSLLLDPGDFTVDATVASNLVTTLNGGTNVVISTNGSATDGNGDVFINADVSYDSSAFFGILAHRHIRANANVQNNGTGDVVLVAGWDGIGAPGSGVLNPFSFSYSNIANTPSSYGNSDGSVFIGNGSQAEGIAVGSRFGATQVAAHQLRLRGSNSTDNAFAQLGYRGGTGSDGAIQMALHGDLLVHAGGADNAYAQVGHGGRDQNGSHAGDITLSRANDLSVLAGGFRSYAQLGHGGHDADGDHGGAISIGPVHDITVRGGGTLAYGQVGHGGFASGGNRTGDIAIAQANDVLVQGGNGLRAFAQVGHGGNFSTGDNSGGIAIAQARNLSLRAGESSVSYAQLGHGGRNQTTSDEGDHDGDITVSLANDLLLEGGDEVGTDTYAFLGHGDNNTTEGTRSGDIDITVGGETSLVDNRHAWFLGHGSRGNQTITDASLTLRTHTLDYSSTTTSTRVALNQTFANRMTIPLDGGDVTIVSTNTTEDLIVDGSFVYDSANNLSLVSQTDLRINADIQNGGSTSTGQTGEVNLLAGWDGSTGVSSPLDMGAIFAAPSSYGNGDGSVFIGNGSQTEGIAVGSRFGATQVAAHQLRLRGSNSTDNAFAQLGYRGGTSSDGAIQMALQGDLLVHAGGADNAYAQVGHGGRDQNGAHAGDITLSRANDLSLLAGGFRSYAQLGHGGYDADGDHGGAISIGPVQDITVRGGGTLAYGQVGHGGFASGGNRTGDIAIAEANDVLVQGGNGLRAFAQVGHGGNFSTGDNSGRIAIAQARNLSLRAGESSVSYAQLGHGGRNQTTSDEGDHDGDITVSLANDLLLEGGDEVGTDTYAFLGHGDNNTTEGTRSGDIHLTVGGETSLVNNRHAWFLGHGSRGDQTITDASLTLRTHTLDYSSGTTSTRVALNQTFANRMTIPLDGGDVTIVSTNTTEDLIVDGSFVYDSANNLSLVSQTDLRINADIQNGGGTSTGQTGEVNLVAGWDGSTGVSSPLDMGAIFAAPSSYGNSDGSVFIGNGSQTEGIAVGSRFGATQVAAHQLRLRGSDTTEDSYALLGFKADSTQPSVEVNGSIKIALQSDLIAQGGSQNDGYAQVGQGGKDFEVFDPEPDGNYRGDIEVSLLGDLQLIAGPRQSYAQLGNGGLFAEGSHSGDIIITQVNELSLQAGEGIRSYAQIGHGGPATTANHTGDITIVQANDVLLRGEGTFIDNYAQIGHGGTLFSGDHVGDINIERANNLTLEGAGTGNYAQVGHGRASTVIDGKNSGNVSLNLLQSVTLSGGLANSPARLGHAVASQGITGNLTLAIDQANPVEDGGGRLRMLNEFTAIGMGGEPNQVRIFDTRREGPSPQVIANGATINGVTFDSTGSPGSLGSSWTPNTEFFSWDHEHWGNFTVASPSPYTAPFTFSFILDDLAPSITVSSVTVDENQTAVTTATAVDPDTGDLAPVFSLSGTDSALFDIDSSKGVITFKLAPDFETPRDSDQDNVYDVVVTATDGNDGSLSDSQAIAVTVQNVEEAPTLTVSSVSVNENQIGATTAVAVDPDSGDVDPVFSLSGIDAALFDIDSSSGVITFKSAPDFEAPQDGDKDNGYELTVTATDGDDSNLSDSQAITVTVQNVNEPPTPPVDADGASNEVTEGAGNGTSAGITASSVDVDSPTITYRLIDDAGGRFAIDPSTGAVTVANGSLLDGPAMHAITVEAIDGEGGTSTTDFSVTVTNAAPSITGLTSSNPDLESKSANGQVTISGTFFDPAGALDSHTVEVDFGDGSSVRTLTAAEVNQSSDSFTSTHAYDRGGIFTITVTVRDEDGGVSASETTEAVVTGVGLSNGILQIIGTDGRDRIFVTKHRGKIRVKTGLHSRSWRTDDFDLNKVTSIRIYACNGNDYVSVSRRIDRPTLIDGGAGNDVLTGGKGNDLIRGGEGNDFIDGGQGNDILLGDNGNDLLRGSSGRDLLIGGEGRDLIFGGGGQDILVGGTTKQDDSDAALQAVMEEWTESTSYDQRPDAVQSLLTVEEDESRDLLVGGAERDLFFAALTDALVARRSNETVV